MLNIICMVTTNAIAIEYLEMGTYKGYKYFAFKKVN